MDTAKIKIEIAGKVFSLNAKEGDQFRILAAAEDVNKQFSYYKEKLGMVDKTDILCMIAFDSVFEKLSAQQKTADTENEVATAIEILAAQVER